MEKLRVFLTFSVFWTRRLWNALFVLLLSLAGFLGSKWSVF